MVFVLMKITLAKCSIRQTFPFLNELKSSDCPGRKEINVCTLQLPFPQDIVDS